MAIREVHLLPKAAADVAEAQLFYEEQSPGLGSYFRLMINSDLRTLALNGGIHRIVYRMHRSVSKRFPYAIFYKVIDDAVFVYAVLDSRQDPASIRRRLHGR